MIQPGKSISSDSVIANNLLGIAQWAIESELEFD